MVAVYSPIDGVVLHRYLQSATPVQAGQALLELGDLEQLQVMAQVLSQQASLLQPGTAAQVLRWGGEGALPARVARIRTGGYTKISALGVEEQRTQVWLDIVAPREQWLQLGDGYRVEVALMSRAKSAYSRWRPAPCSVMEHAGQSTDYRATGCTWCTSNPECVVELRSRSTTGSSRVIAWRPFRTTACATGCA